MSKGDDWSWRLLPEHDHNDILLIGLKSVKT